MSFFLILGAQQQLQKSALPSAHVQGPREEAGLCVLVILKMLKYLFTNMESESALSGSRTVLLND